MAENVNYGDPDTTWRAQEYLPREIDEKSGKIKKKVGLPDQKKVSEAYRENYSKVFNHD